MNAISPATITTASRQWATRPADERYTSLIDMQQHFNAQRAVSRDRVISTRGFRAAPVDGDHKGLVVEALTGRAGSSTEVSLPTHWSFGQLANLSGAPASYLRKLPSELAADCFNYGMRQRDVGEVKLLLRDDLSNGVASLSAATGPNYGRIWNGDIVDALVSRFGDGVEGKFRVPGEFGEIVPVTRENTTLYASDRDMFVFLADEQNRIDIPDRRGGRTGSMARGFFVWNSEVGDGTFGIATFLFDYVCKNRIVWGAEGYKEVRIRHTSGAPDRYIEEVAPALVAYANSETRSITEAIDGARQARVENIDDFLSKRFTTGQVKGIKLAHEVDEDRPIETVWDAVTGITAYARGIPNQNDRVTVERAAGVILSSLK